MNCIQFLVLYEASDYVCRQRSNIKEFSGYFSQIYI